MAGGAGLALLAPHAAPAMTPERWHQITAIFHAALARAPADRSAFVAATCNDDHGLRTDVERMLAAHAQAGSFGDAPAFATAAMPSSDASPNLVALLGTRLGPYEIDSLLGVGGMGVVYRARDTRLRREVALKALLPAVADDPDRLARFSREAQLLASLNHPNIAQIHNVEEWNGIRLLDMELVEGSTLAERVADGPLALDEALAIARQIATALEAAHERNIVHRDLKPANVKLRPDGTVKVLDFGLSKVMDEGVDGSHPARQAADQTTPGVLLGTASYMAPEQAKGKAVDKRADIWAFGCVLFEMLTGRRAFDGDGAVEALVAVIEHDPDYRLLPADTPVSVRRLLRQCLEKDSARRLDSAAVARREIDEVSASTARRTAAVRGAIDRMLPTDSSRLLRWAVGTIAVGVALALALGDYGTAERSETEARVPRLQNAVQVTFSLDVESYPAWSPDGRRLAYQASEGGWYYVGNHDIWVADVGRGEPTNITRGHPGNDRMPSWSPDGRNIAFFSDRDAAWGVYLVPATGGDARLILALPDAERVAGSAPRWSRDGGSLFVSTRHAGENLVLVLSLATLQTTRVTLPEHDGNVCFDLAVSPDGRRFAYVEGGSGETEVTRLWTAASSGVDAVPLTDGQTNVWSPTWSGDGRAIFYVSNRGGSMDLWQQAVTADGRPVGDARAVTQGLGIRSAAFSADGTRLAYTHGRRVSNVWRVPILSERPASWSDAVQLTAERAFIEFVNASPRGDRLAVSSDRRGNQDLWLLSARDGAMTPLTSDPTPEWAPRWSPDGEEIAFYSYRTGNRDVWVMSAGGGPARPLTAHPAQDRNPRWSPDGGEVLFHSSRPENRGWWIVGKSGGQPRFVMSSGDSGDDGADWSPDGQSVVLSTRGRLYRVPRAGGNPVLLPSTGERPYSPQFSRDGHSIYYGVVTGPREAHDLWRVSLVDGSISPLTNLQGRRGRLGYVFSADAQYLYFTWGEDDGDIWVIDVAGEGNS